MYVLRLLHCDRPFEQLDARLFAEGRLSIGRDPGADWVLEDPGVTLSRLHCVLAIEEGRLVLYDKSTNGVFFANGDRAPFDAPVQVAERQSLRLGSFSILVDRPDPGLTNADATTVVAPGWTEATPLADAWSETPPLQSHRDASLVEAFCEGAKLDASVLSSEDPADLMRRIGAVYQQTVLGLAALMADRDKLKREGELKRTTIAASDNNPFRWTPSRKLAEDLLCSRESAFLSAAPAVRACFEDLSLHMTGVLAGARAAVQTLQTTLDPDAISSEAKTRASLLRGHAATALDILHERHARLREHGVREVFAEAYEKASARAPQA